MNSQEIEKILLKYYNGESSLEEEAMLRDYFTHNEVPNGMAAIRDQLLYMQSQKEIKAGKDFDREFTNKIESTRVISLFRTRRSKIFAISGLAASVILMIALYIQFNTFTQKMEDTYSDPKVAYAEARRILTFVSGQFNRGTKEVENVSKFQDGMKDIDKVSKLDAQMKNISRVQDLDQVKKFLTGNKQ